jgi:hypothetical protein
VKIVLVKRPPTKKELRESERFYKSIGPLGRKRERHGR